MLHNSIFLIVSNRLSTELRGEICSGNPLHRRGRGGQVGSLHSVLYCTVFPNTESTLKIPSITNVKLTRKTILINK